MKSQIKSLFGINANDAAMVEVGEGTHPLIPAVKPYIFREDAIWDILAWSTTGFGALFISGPTGSGKTSIVTQAAARLRIPLYSVTAHDRMESPELIGRFVVRDGNMVWVDGPLIRAMKEGVWFLLNEMDFLEPATLAGLNNILEGSPHFVEETGEWVVAQPGFRFAATGNTNGSGDATGLYCGTKQQNIAARDRFCPVINIDYPTEEQELAVMAAATPQIQEDVRKTMISCANLIRHAFVAGEVDVPLSTRVLINWANYASFFQPLTKKDIDPIAYAFDRVCANKASDDSKAILHELLQRSFGTP